MSELEALWSDFVSYIERAPAANHPGIIFAGFRDQLVAAGWSDEKASATIREITAMAATRREWTAPMFDRIYRSPEPGFSTRPNALLVETISGRSPGTAVDIAMGQGRNALFLAEQGWEVSGFDISGEGIALALMHAAERGLSINARVAAHDEFEFGSERWDLVVMTYALVPLTDAGFARTVVDSLRPGGVVVIESFGPEPDRGPRAVDIDPEHLRGAYTGLQVIKFEDVTDIPDWTQEAARVIRMAATKP